MADTSTATSTSPYEWVGRLSAGALLAAALVTGQMGFWVWGSQLDDVKKDRDEWKSLALKGTAIAERAAPHVVGMAPPAPSPEAATAADVKARLDRVSRVITPDAP